LGIRCSRQHSKSTQAYCQKAHFFFSVDGAKQASQEELKPRLFPAQFGSISGNKCAKFEN
jgi:hypothetical protein